MSSTVDDRNSNPLKAAIDQGVATVSELMTGTGFSRSKVQRHVKGERTPSLSDRTAYARVLRIEPDAFDKLWFGDIAQAISQGMGA